MNSASVVLAALACYRTREPAQDDMTDQLFHELFRFLSTHRVVNPPLIDQYTLAGKRTNDSPLCYVLLSPLAGRYLQTMKDSWCQ